MIYDVIKKTLKESLGIEEEMIHPNAMIKKDLQLDSTETVAVSLELKKIFNIDFKFPAEDLSLEAIRGQVEAMCAAV